METVPHKMVGLEGMWIMLCRGVGLQRFAACTRKLCRLVCLYFYCFVILISHFILFFLLHLNFFGNFVLPQCFFCVLPFSLFTLFSFLGATYSSLWLKVPQVKQEYLIMQVLQCYICSNSQRSGLTHAY